MYGFQGEIIPVNLENVLSRTTEEEIFALVFEEPIVEDERITSPFRADNAPNCFFARHEDKLWFIDFADVNNKYRDCISTIIDYYNLSFYEALDYINSNLNLGLGLFAKMGTKPVIREISNVVKSFKPIDKKILMYPREFNLEDKKYWFDRYGVTREQLKEDGVIPLKMYTANSRKGVPFSVKPVDVMYAYTEFESKNVKIYRPLTLDTLGKWFTNCNANDIGNLQNVDYKLNYVILSKSYKDCRVLRNLGLNVLWLQNEGMLPSPEILYETLKGFERIFIWFDNDTTGITMGYKVKEILDNIFLSKGISPEVKNIFLPPVLRNEGITDPSDLVHIKSYDSLKEFTKTFNFN